MLSSAEARRRVSLLTERDRWVCARNYKHLAPLTPGNQASRIPGTYLFTQLILGKGEETRVNGALYYFGHGLSYTTFAYSNLRVSSAVRMVWVDIKNTGTRAGDEVVQLYTRQLVSSVTTYEKNLRGFERVHLKPGESKTVDFYLPDEELAIWDSQMHFVVEPGTFRVMIGSSSEDIRVNGELTVGR